MARDGSTIHAMANEKMVYMISPVRNVTDEQARMVAEHARKLKLEGAKVFNPIEDAFQDDPTGFNIVMSELNFMYEASRTGGRVDILWNAGGTPSEGSRVDLGIAIALRLEFNLVTIFNEENPTGSQLGSEIVKEIQQRDLRNSPFLMKIMRTMDEIESYPEVEIDWDMEMTRMGQEWQRIYLGLVLGCMAKNPNLKIKMGYLNGDDPADRKSYVKVIREIERIQNL